MNRSTLTCAAALAAGVAVWSAPAQGQEAIVVIAERRPQALAEEASSVAALQRDELARVGAQHPAEALNRLPGFNFHRGSGVESLPAIRSPVLNGGQGAGSVLVLEDGVPIRAAPFANINQVYELNLEFAERLEAIRGPGAAVHGANAVHGAIDATMPRPGEPGSAFEIEAGSFGRARLSALVRGETALAAFAARHEEGWRAEAGLDVQKALLAWRGEAEAWRLYARVSALNLEQETAGFAVGPRAYDWDALARANPNAEAFRDSRIVRAAITGERSVGGAEFTLTPFARHIETDLLLHFFPSKALEQTAQSGAGLQASVHWRLTPTWRVLAGLDLDRSRARLRETQSLPTVGSFPQGVHYDYAVSAHTLAAYAQTTWRPAPAWTASFGARSERIDYDYDNRAPDGSFGRFLRTPDREDSFAVTTARFGLLRALPWGSVHFNLAAGGRAPQASDLYSLQTTQAPGAQGVERIVSAEIGARVRFGPVRGELVVYDMHKQGGAFRNANGLTVDDTRTSHRGAELWAEAPLSRSFTMTGWVAYADHRYGFDEPGSGIVDGARIESAPEWLGALTLLWRMSPAAELELSWSHVGGYITEASGAHAYPGHDVFALRGAWRINDRAEAFAAIRNLTGTDYAERADFAFGQERYFPGEDRAFSFGLRLSR